jgi:hypothetical protein
MPDRASNILLNTSFKKLLSLETPKKFNKTAIKTLFFIQKKSVFLPNIHFKNSTS